MIREEDRQEAQRLLTLDQGGLDSEAVALALAIGRASDESIAGLADLDRAFLNWFAGHRGRDGEVGSESAEPAE